MIIVILIVLVVIGLWWLYQTREGYNSGIYDSYPNYSYPAYNSNDGSIDTQAAYDAHNAQLTHDVMNRGISPHPFITYRRWLRAPITVYIRGIAGAGDCWDPKCQAYLCAWQEARAELEPMGVRFIMLNSDDACDFPGTMCVFKVKCGKHGLHGGHIFNYFGPADRHKLIEWILDAVN